MKRRMKRTMYLSVIICIGLFGLIITGCNDTDIGNYSVSFEGVTSYSGGKTEFIAICGSYGNLAKVCASNGYDFFDCLDNECDIAECKQLRTYDNEYFKYKSLILCSFTKGCFYGKYHVDSIEVNDGKLTMYIKSPDTDIGLTVVTSYLLLVEVDKSFVAGVKNSEYIFT